MARKQKAQKPLTVAEMNAKVQELKKELFDLKFSLAVGQLENTAQIGKIKKQIARLKTAISQQQNA